MYLNFYKKLLSSDTTFCFLFKMSGSKKKEKFAIRKKRPHVTK